MSTKTPGASPDVAAGRSNTTVNCIKNDLFLPVGSAALAKAAYRYGFRHVRNGYIAAPKGPRDVVVRMATAGDLTDATEVGTKDIQEDLDFYLPVTIGSPGVKLNLTPDTGAADFRVWTIEAAKASSVFNTREIPHVYDPDKSKTAEEDVGLSWKQSFADGAGASGPVFKDQVKVGSLTVTKQDIECAQKVTDTFIDVTSDGFIGLGFKSNSTVRDDEGMHVYCHTLIEQMAREKLLQHPIFTTSLSRNDPLRSFFTFGSIDKGSVHGQGVKFFDVNDKKGFWEVPVAGWTLNGKKEQYTVGASAVFDTGTTLILVDDQMVERFYCATLNPAQTGYVFPVDAQLPELTFIIGNNSDVAGKNTIIVLDPETLKYGLPDASGMVFGTVQSCGDLGFAVFGEKFLQNAYVVFDCAKPTRVGLVQKVAI